MDSLGQGAILQRIPTSSGERGRTGLSSVPRLGVGILYNPALPDFLRNHLDAVDYVEVIPDMFWTDRGIDRSPRYVETESWIDFLAWIAARHHLIAHNISLSIGS